MIKHNPYSAPTIRFKKIHPDAKIPTCGTDQAAGLDLYAIEDVLIPPCECPNGLLTEDVVIEDHIDVPVRVGQADVRTGLSLAVPIGFYGKNESRSGLSFKNGIEVGAGVIDADYRGELKVKLYNFTEEPYLVRAGDRIAQLVVNTYLVCDPEEVDELDETERGEGGFGSTGK
jgi:dUTP pyrophosphatase